jgi:hypothetical protein
MSKESTINAIIKRDKDRFISIAKGELSNFSSMRAKHFTYRKELAEEIFSESVKILLEKYSEIVDMNYQLSEKILYKIVLITSKLIGVREIKQNHLNRVGIEKFKLIENKIEREKKGKNRDKTRASKRKSTRKQYYLSKKDPEKWKKYLEYQKNYKRLHRKNKKEGKLKNKDLRFFDKNDPFMHIRKKALAKIKGRTTLPLYA